MAEPDNYDIKEVIYDSSNTTVARAVRVSDGRSVILKMPKSEHPTSAELDRYRREYALLSTLSCPEIVGAYAFEKRHGTPILVLEDVNGVSLRVAHGEQPMAVREFLEVALATCAGLERIHAQRIVHKDICPSNIIVNRETKAVKIIDFGISSRLSEHVNRPGESEGTLAYMPPEQTGRTNVNLDYRADLYALGATFYELLTGNPPFRESDPLELIHCHIAKQPKPPKQLRPELPEQVSAIILKLLAKNVGERYQSAGGLHADLERCLELFDERGEIARFSLGRHDQPGILQIPDRLYGRERELDRLEQTFERVCRSQRRRTELLMVAGYSGIGKSALIKTLYAAISRERGYFISGKFDQYQRNVPYSAVSAAFSELLRQLLAESSDRLRTWKQRLSEALGRNSGLIIDVIPELELFVGPGEELEALGPTEARNRFNLAFRQFIRVFCQPSHPLVVFLDDLQWADSASLELIELIMRDSELSHMLLIGAYRDNEVDATHPMKMMLARMRKHGTNLTELTLEPLTIGQLGRLIADTLRRNDAPVRELAELVMDKTGGNPFFVRQFLQLLYAEHLLIFEAQQWTWDIAKIEEVGITDNVVDLMIRKLSRLPPETGEVLRIAACIGNRFDLRVLSIVAKRSTEELFEALRPALQARMVEPTSGLESISQDTLALDLVIFNYRFLHDRVQEAAYELTSPDERGALHLEIGRLLLASTPEDQREANVFELVEHLNAAAELVSDPDERRAYAALNLSAGRKAREAMAYDPAARYLAAGRAFLDADTESWTSHYDLTFQLHVASIEVLYLAADMDGAQTLSQEVIAHAASVLDKVEVYELQMMSRVAKNEHLESLATAREALALLGLELPTEPDEMVALGDQLRAELDALVTDIDALAELDELDDPIEEAKLRILVHASAPAYNAQPALLVAVVLAQTRICVQHGNSPMACTAYVWQAVVVGAIFGDIDSAYRWGLLAVEVLERFNARKWVARVQNLFNGFVREWKEHLRETMEPMVIGFHSGMETGDIEFGLYSAIQYCNNLLHIGDPLEFVETERGKFHRLAIRLEQHYHVDYFGIGLQMVLNLLGRAEDPLVLVGSALDERDKLPQWEQENVTFAFMTYHCKTVLAYLLGEPGRAIEMAEAAARYDAGGSGLYYWAMQDVYHCLALLAHFEHLDDGAREAARELIEAKQALLAERVSHAPMNFQNKHDLVEAERARIAGDHTRAMELYDRAIEGAREQGFVQEEAIAAELAASFYWTRGRQFIARAYINQARAGFVRWEAHAKVEVLDELWRGRLHTAPLATPELVTRTTSANISLGQLDVTTVLRASQAISGELVLDKLLGRVLDLIMVNAGADRGALLFDNEGELMIEALGTPTGGIEVELHTPLTNSDSLPISLIQYVARTGERVVIDDSTKAKQFSGDPYIVDQAPRSILCAPITNQSRQLGILYLENNMVYSAFTRDRIDVLELLSAQAAISFENARLYETMEHKVDRRTAQLRAKNDELGATLESLRRAQKQLVVQEKLASLGQLTAGIAHEIRNPLNFINNFASSAVEFLDELNELLDEPEDDPEERAELIEMLQKTLRGINNHGERANGIVTNMLEHAKHSTGTAVRADFNGALHQSVRLAYHGVRAKYPGFDVTIEEDYDDAVEPFDFVQEDMSRVFLNLFENACYAVRKRGEKGEPGYKGRIWCTTRKVGDRVEARIRDNGPGIPADVGAKIFEPFFTTKPAGEGTGLGLSISHDIVAQGAHGSLRMESEVGEGTTFIIELPTSISPHEST